MVKKYEALFRNRWRAVLWSLGILLTAYCTVPSPDGDDATSAIVNVVTAHAPAQAPPPPPVNPWAKG